jgi:hypothetical protein
MKIPSPVSAPVTAKHLVPYKKMIRYTKSVSEGPPL